MGLRKELQKRITEVQNAREDSESNLRTRIDDGLMECNRYHCVWLYHKSFTYYRRSQEIRLFVDEQLTTERNNAARSRRMTAGALKV